MNCPNCNVMLSAADRQGVEIDYCPKCWGVWLDRGELNLLIERSAGSPIEDETPECESLTIPGGPAKPQRDTFWKDMFDFS